MATVTNTIPRICPECEGKLITVDICTVNKGATMDGRIRLNETAPLVFFSCLECSATIHIDTDTFLRIAINALGLVYQ